MAFAALLFFDGCGVKDEEGLTPQGLYNRGVVSPAIQPSPTDALDTVLPSGWTIDFREEPDDYYAISWSAPDGTTIGRFKSESCMSHECAFAYQCEFEHYIGLKNSCGHALWALKLLPKSKSDTAIIIVCDLAADTKRGYVLSSLCDVNDSGDFCLLDLNTKKHHPFSLEGLPETGFASALLDEIAFQDGGVHLWWNDTDEYMNARGMRDTVITLQ